MRIFEGRRWCTFVCLAGLACVYLGCTDTVDDGAVTAPDAGETDAFLPDIANGESGESGESEESEQSGESGESEESSETPSHISRAALDALERSDFQAWHGRIWNITTEAALPDDWIVETPPADTWGGSAADLNVVEDCEGTEADCDPDFGLVMCSTDGDCRNGGSCEPVEATVTAPEQTPESLCVGHSRHAYEVYYQAIIEATELVDITSLYPPDGPFLAAIRNGLTYLEAAGESPEVRFQFGSIILDEVDVDEVLDGLIRDLSASTDLAVAVGTYREGFDSWNHAKIAAIDGEFAIVGGMNMSTNSYLRAAPVFDLTMKMVGPSARDAHFFADQLWSYSCDGLFFGDFGLIDHATTFPNGECPTKRGERLSDGAAAGDVWVASLGRLGDIGENVADSAIMAALDSAKDSIRLSVQDLGPLQIGPVESYAWSSSLLDMIGRAIARGVSVEILMTTPVVGDEGGGSGDDGAYSNGWTKQDAVLRVENRLRLNDFWLPDGTTAQQAICEHLSVASIRPFEEERWSDGTEYANHAKSFIIDDQAFYIGSQNLYPAELAEFGYLVDDQSAAQKLVDNYWNPLWNSSQSTVEQGC